MRLAAAQAEQRAGDAGSHCRQARRAASAEQCEQYRFRLVVGCVASQCVRSEQIEASCPGPGLKICAVVELCAAAGKDHPKTIGDPLRSGRLVVGFGADPVVDMDRNNLKFCSNGKREQSAGVGSPRKATGDFRSRRWEGAPGEKFAAEPNCVGSQRS